jgi:hypothetical protein
VPLSASAAAAEHLLTAYQLLLGRLGASHPATSAAAFALGQHLAAAAATAAPPQQQQQQQQSAAAGAWLRRALQGYCTACGITNVPTVGGEQAEEIEGNDSSVTRHSAVETSAKGTLAVAQAAVALARVLLGGRSSSSSGDGDSSANGELHCIK